MIAELEHETRMIASPTIMTLTTVWANFPLKYSRMVTQAPSGACWHSENFPLIAPLSIIKMQDVGRAIGEGQGSILIKRLCMSFTPPSCTFFRFSFFVMNHLSYSLN